MYLYPPRQYFFTFEEVSTSHPFFHARWRGRGREKRIQAAFRQNINHIFTNFVCTDTMFILHNQIFFKKNVMIGRFFPRRLQIYG
jgi:hypothetical protein